MRRPRPRKRWPRKAQAPGKIKADGKVKWPNGGASLSQSGAGKRESWEKRRVGLQGEPATMAAWCVWDLQNLQVSVRSGAPDSPQTLSSICSRSPFFSSPQTLVNQGPGRTACARSSPRRPFPQDANMRCATHATVRVKTAWDACTAHPKYHRSHMRIRRALEARRTRSCTDGRGTEPRGREPGTRRRPAPPVYVVMTIRGQGVGAPCLPKDRHSLGRGAGVSTVVRLGQDELVADFPGLSDLSLFLAEYRP